MKTRFRSLLQTLLRSLAYRPSVTERRPWAVAAVCAAATLLLPVLTFPVYAQPSSDGRPRPWLDTGQPTAQRIEQLLREVLKGEWDWGGVVGAVNGGLDQAFTGLDWGKWYSQLPELVRAGEVSEALIDAHVRRILRMMFRLGMLDGRPEEGLSKEGLVDVEAHGAVAREIAEQGAVLLKNEGNLLPLDAASLESVAVIGRHAEEALTGGGGSSHVLPYYAVSPVEGIERRVGASVRVRSVDGSDVEQAAALARMDVAVVVVNDENEENEDRPHIDLPGDQNVLVEAVAEANPRTVVVLETGGAVTLPWLSRIDALLELWYPGQEGGSALAALLFGDVHPSGRLPLTFPKSLGQSCCHALPRCPHTEDEVYEYSEGLRVGYRWYDAENIEPLFPFGYGLSYTTFTFSDLRISPKPVNPDGAVTVSLQVENTGDRTGAAVSQVHLRFPEGVGKPPRSLVAARKVQLAPGERQRVTMTVPCRAFSYWHVEADTWDVAPGTYTLSGGVSSRDLPLSGVFEVQNAEGHQRIAVEAPEVASDGTSVTATVTLENTGDHPLTQLQAEFRTPHGWSAAPVADLPTRVEARDQVRLTYQIDIPEGAGPALYILAADARWEGVASGSVNKAASIRARE